MVTTDQNKILLVQLYSYGDCLYATAIAKQVKKDFPGIHLTWAIAPFCKNILNNNPFIDEVLVIDEVPRNDVAAFRKLKKKFKNEEKKGLWKRVFITHIMDTNLAYYDGCIRSNIFGAYPYSVNVDVTPVLCLSPDEECNADVFATKHALGTYKHVILFEFAPQSGQIPITTETAISIAEKLTTDASVAVILASAITINHRSKNIIDGSVLSFREVAALTKHCTLLIGCSSGISWMTTTSCAKLLPMIQLVNPDAYWANPVSRDFERFGKSTLSIIDLIDFGEGRVVTCVCEAMKDFQQARLHFNQSIPLKFNTTRKIIYNLLCYFHFRSISTHIRVNVTRHGHKLLFYREVAISFITFPFKLSRNIILKKFSRTSGNK